MGRADLVVAPFGEASVQHLRPGAERLAHAGAKTDDGFLVVNLWPSKEESEAAARDPRRLGIVERAEIEREQIRREHYEVAHHVVFD